MFDTSTHLSTHNQSKMPYSILKSVKSLANICSQRKNPTFIDDTVIPIPTKIIETERQYSLKEIDELLEKIEEVLNGTDIWHGAWYWANDIEKAFPQYY